MPENSSNKFKEHFGLIPIDPTKNFYEHPCAGTLADMPKAVQTEEMVLLALETEKPYAFPRFKLCRRGAENRGDMR